MGRREVSILVIVAVARISVYSECIQHQINHELKQKIVEYLTRHSVSFFFKFLKDVYINLFLIKTF